MSALPKHTHKVPASQNSVASRSRLLCRSRQSERDRAARLREGQLRRRLGEDNQDGLPVEGYFKQADTKAPVYKPFTGTDTGDVTKRSGNRWESDFIWNTKWQARMDYEAQTAEEQRKLKAEKVQRPAGFLSISRVQELNSLDVDVTKQLTQPPVSSAKPVPIIQMVPVQAGADKNTASQSEEKRYKRAKGFVKRYQTSESETVPVSEGIQLTAAEEQARYEELKRAYNLWTTGTAAACFAVVYSFYTRDVAASYLIGALGGIAYLRLLNRSVDNFAGTTGGQAAVVGLTQPRLLIPLVLVMFYNRYNLLFADSLELHLQLLPMLLGFFTYKVGVLSQGAVTLFRDMVKPDGQSVGVADGGALDTGDSAAGGNLENVEKAFAQRVLTR